MLSKQQIEAVVLESFVTLNKEKQEGQKIPVSNETVLLGSGSPLDSLDFVVIITDIEDQLFALTGEVIPLGTDLKAFQEGNPFRTVATLRRHIEKIIETGSSND
jgi:acyl carrier protein